MSEKIEKVIQEMNSVLLQTQPQFTDAHNTKYFTHKKIIEMLRATLRTSQGEREEFAIHHVTEALKAALASIDTEENTTTDDIDVTQCPYDWAEYNMLHLSKEDAKISILNSYPITNITEPPVK